MDKIAISPTNARFLLLPGKTYSVTNNPQVHLDPNKNTILLVDHQPDDFELVITVSPDLLFVTYVKVGSSPILKDLLDGQNPRPRFTGMPNNAVYTMYPWQYRNFYILHKRVGQDDTPSLAHLKIDFNGKKQTFLELL